MTLIIGASTMTYGEIGNALTRLGSVVTPLFRTDIFPAVHYAARKYGVDPAGAVAQAAHETKFGAFGGRIDARWKNTCGMKKRDLTVVPGSDKDGDLPLCHETFGSWQVGAKVHVQHLLAYAGGFVEPMEIVDPRWDWVDKTVRPAVHFADLDRWATAVGYGAKIEAMISRIRSANSL